MANATGAKAALWNADFNLLPTTYDNSYQLALIPGTLIGRYDARVNVPVNSPLASEGDPSSTFITQPFTDTIGTYLPNVLKYTAKTAYVRGEQRDQYLGLEPRRAGLPDTIPDLAAALTLNPSLKVLSLNGYHDLATPFYQTELDLARLGTQPNLTFQHIPGGHMVYLDDTSRPAEKTDLVTFYEATPPRTDAPRRADRMGGRRASSPDRGPQTQLEPDIDDCRVAHRLSACALIGPGQPAYAQQDKLDAAAARAAQAQLGDPDAPPAARRPTAGTETTRRRAAGPGREQARRAQFDDARAAQRTRSDRGAGARGRPWLRREHLPARST